MSSKKSLLTRFVLWRRRNVNDQQFLIFLSILVGVLVGLAAVVIKTSVHWISHVLISGFEVDYLNYRFIVYPAIGILLVVLFKKYVLRRPVGHGIPNVLYAISKNSGVIRGYQIFASVITSAITVGFGGSVGLEGPTVSTGAAIGSNLGQVLHLDYKRITLLIGCACAGAMSAIFKAPIAAIVFALEVIMLDLTMAALVPLLVASVTAALTSYAFLGQTFVYQFNADGSFHMENIPWYILLGVVTGFVSLYFTRMYNFIDQLFDKLQSWVYKLLVGVFVLGILIFFLPSLYGEGYNSINSCLLGDFSYLFNNSMFYDYRDSAIAIVVMFMVTILMKAVATSVTFGSGGIGGVFAPSLFMGANTGLLFANIANQTGVTTLNQSSFALVGMAGLIAGVIHAPLTAIFLIAELTGGYSLFVPLMIVATISYTTIHYFEKNSVYTHQLAKRGELFTHHKDKVVLSLMKVPDLLEKEFLTIDKDANLGELVKVITKSKRNVFPVVDSENNFYGIVHLNDIRHVIFKPELYDIVKVTTLMAAPMTTAALSDSMEEIVEKYQKTHHYNIVVLDKGKYVGFVSRANVLLKYRTLLKHFSED